MFEHVGGGKRETRRERLPAAGVSVLLHLALIAGLFVLARQEVLRVGDPWGDGIVWGAPEGGGGGGGGGSGGEELVSYVDIAPEPQPEPEPVPEPEEDALVPPEPEPVVEPPRPQPPAAAPPTDRPAAPAAPAPGAGTGGGTGGGTGSGDGPGEGSGVGPGSGGGTGGGSGGGIGSGQGSGTGRGESRIRGPQTDVLLIPPDRPSGMASMELTVHLRIDTRGRVREARLSASTGNRGYDERIRRWAMGLVFRPAVNLDTNQPVEGEYSVEIIV